MISTLNNINEHSLCYLPEFIERYGNYPVTKRRNKHILKKDYLMKVVLVPDPMKSEVQCCLHSQGISSNPYPESNQFNSLYCHPFFLNSL